MNAELPVYVGNEALARLAQYLQEQNIPRTLLLADENTYAALGGQVEAAVKGGVKHFIFSSTLHATASDLAWAMRTGIGFDTVPVCSTST